MSYKFMQYITLENLIYLAAYFKAIWYKNYLKLQTGNPFLMSNFNDFNDLSQYSSIGTGSMLCSTLYQQSFFQLPASSPYDNFLKAAGCWAKA